jgi:lysophospholipase L1-like esterase
MLWYEDDIHQLETKLKTLNAFADGVSADHFNGGWANSGWPNPEKVVFYGSSSIRLWTTLETDFPEVSSLNLGFGGSTLAACAWFFERIVVPTAPRSVIFYAGDNDLGDGRHPEEVCLFFNSFTQKMQQHLPGVPLSFLSIKISPARWNIAPKIRQTNELIAQEISRLPGYQVIDVTNPLLDAGGRPRKELFENDGLHLNPAGYEVWKQVLVQHPDIF